MSRYQVAFVRAALIYLVLTGLLGLWLMVDPRWVGAFRVTHVHTGLLGFFLSLVMGVALWLLPRPRGVRHPEVEARTFWLFHGGLALRTIVEPWWRLGGPDLLRPLLVVAGALLVAGIVSFALAAWPRARTAEALRELRASDRA